MAFWLLLLLFQTASSSWSWFKPKAPGCHLDRFLCSNDQKTVYCCTEKDSCLKEWDKRTPPKFTFEKNAEPCKTNSRKKHNKCSMEIEDKHCYQRVWFMDYKTVTSRTFATKQASTYFKTRFSGGTEWQTFYFDAIKYEKGDSPESWAESAAIMAHRAVYDLFLPEGAVFLRYMEALEDRHKKWEEATPDKKESTKEKYGSLAKKMYYRLWLQEWDPKGTAAGVTKATHFPINIPYLTRKRFASETNAMDPTKFATWQGGFAQSCKAITDSVGFGNPKGNWATTGAYGEWKEWKPDFDAKLIAFLDSELKKIMTGGAHIGYSDIFDDDEEYSDDVQSGYGNGYGNGNGNIAMESVLLAGLMSVIMFIFCCFAGVIFGWGVGYAASHMFGSVAKTEEVSEVNQI